MIELERFGERRVLAQRVLDGASEQLTQLLGEPARVALVTRLDDALLARMLELEEEVFRIEDNVYSADDIRECLGEEDSLLLVLWVNDRVEGYVFGFDDEPDDPEVEGTDYFVDSAVVSLAYQAKGIGTRAGLLVLFLLYLAGYRRIGITTEPRDKTGRELLAFYHKLGFSEAHAKRADNYGMKIELSDALMAKLAAQLPGAASVGS
jgi:GNAT superfamily N-acetyltransferase